MSHSTIVTVWRTSTSWSTSGSSTQVLNSRNRGELAKKAQKMELLWSGKGGLSNALSGTGVLPSSSGLQVFHRLFFGLAPPTHPPTQQNSQLRPPQFHLYWTSCKWQGSGKPPWACSINRFVDWWTSSSSYQLVWSPCQWYVSCPENYECKINGILVPANLLSLEQVSFPASPLLLLPRPTHPALPAHTQPFPPQRPFYLLSILTLHSAAETMTTGLEYMFGCKLVLPITGWCFPIESRSKAWHGCGRLGSTQSGKAPEQHCVSGFSSFTSILRLYLYHQYGLNPWVW